MEYSQPLAPPQFIGNPSAQNITKGVVVSCNDALNKTLEQFVADNNNKIEYFHLFDVAGLMQAALQPQITDAMNIHNLTGACVINNGGTDYENITVCDDGYNHFFYDRVHPSARVHYLAGIVAANLLFRTKPLFVTSDALLNFVHQYNIGNATAEDNILANNNIHNVGTYELESSSSDYNVDLKSDTTSGTTKPLITLASFSMLLGATTLLYEVLF